MQTVNTKKGKTGKTVPDQSTGPTIAEVLHLAADEYLWNGRCPRIAEVLHLTADEYLWDGYCPRIGTTEYSCYAIERACYSLKASIRLELRVYEGLKRMGLKVNSLTQFDSIKSDHQGARYAWLKFAAMIAEEQGV